MSYIFLCYVRKLCVSSYLSLFFVIYVLCCTDPERKNPVASVNVAQEIPEMARSLKGLYYLEQKEEK
jgi:hypothetical protein